MSNTYNKQFMDAVDKLNKMAKVEKVKFENTPRETVVNIIKVDASTGNPLAGAVLLVKDSTGTTVAQFTSTTEPYVLTDLDNGTYTVEEVSAPAGYKHSTEIKTFVSLRHN